MRCGGRLRGRVIADGAPIVVKNLVNFTTNLLTNFTTNFTTKFTRRFASAAYPGYRSMRMHHAFSSPARDFSGGGRGDAGRYGPAKQTPVESGPIGVGGGRGKNLGFVGTGCIGLRYIR